MGHRHRCTGTLSVSVVGDICTKMCIRDRGRFGGADSFLAIDQALTQSDMDKAKAGGVTTAFYTVSRVSGEGADRTIGKGDYELPCVYFT